jgi:transcriptional regulator with XRE-family HTH domain
MPLGDHLHVAGRARIVDDAKINSRRLQAELGAELRDARIGRGLRQIDVAKAADSSHSHVSRLEAGQLAEAGVGDLARHGAAVGLRLYARFYPAGGGLRDAAQLDLLRRLRARIGDRWSWQLEAPLNIAGDLRAFDALLTRGDLVVAVEAITRLRDAQAQLRAATLKQRDGRVGRLVLLLRKSDANRRALGTAGDVLTTGFPLSTRATLAAMAEGDDPGDNGIVLL